MAHTHPTRINPMFSLGSARDLAVSGTRLFAAAGGAGLKSVDISAPSHPRWLGGYSSGGGIHNLVAAEGLTVATSAMGGLQILELSDSREPRQIGVHVTQSPVSKVALAGQFAYVAEIGDQEGHQQVGGRLEIVDLSDPAHPRRAGAHELAGAVRGVALSGTVACLALGELGLQTVDVSNPRAPRGLGRLHTHGIALDVVIDRHYAWVANGGPGVQVIDVLDPSHPRLVGGHATGGAAERVEIVGNRVYVTDRLGGLLEFDTTNPANPRVLRRLAVASRDNSGLSFSALSDGYACLIDASGLRVVDFHDPDRPTAIASLAGFSPWLIPAFSAGKLYLPDGSNRLGIVELLPFFRSASHASGEIHLEWEGWGKARLQHTRVSAIPDWQNVLGPETRQSLSLPASGLDAIFRLYRP